MPLTIINYYHFCRHSCPFCTQVLLRSSEAANTVATAYAQQALMYIEHVTSLHVYQLLAILPSMCCIQFLAVCLHGSDALVPERLTCV